jgi:hypothetical protein
LVLAGSGVADAMPVDAAHTDATPGGEPADAARSGAPSSESEPRAQPRAVAPWPQLAALAPGVLIHGSGTWLQGRTLTTERLLLLEASALLAIIAGGVVIYETGAARDYAGPATLVVAAGVGTWGASLLGSVYATAAPPAGWGEPLRRLPWLEAGLGYTYVDDAQFAGRHFATTRLDGRVGPFRLVFDAAQSPGADEQWLEVQTGYRLWGPRASPRLELDGSYLEPRVGWSRHAFGEDGFASHVLALELEGRLDSQRLLPDVRGAFFQAAAGLARQWVVYALPGADATDSSGMLLLHVGFGVYLGRWSTAPSSQGALASGGELELYYDHRRDGFAGGIETRGATSGFAGHVGLTADWYFTSDWGLRALGELGSNWVLGLSALLRVGAS